MAKYDAFGRKIGEDTLEGLGGSQEEAARPEPATRPTVHPDPAVHDRAHPGPASPDRAALAAQLRGALSQVAAARSAPAAPRVARRPAGRGCLAVLAILGLVIAGIVVAGGVVGGKLEGGVSDAIRERVETLEPAPAPRGLGARSLVPRAAFATALGRLRATGLRLTSLRVAPERIDAQLLTRGGRLRSVQVTPGGRLERFGPDSGPGFDTVGTIPFARLRPGAPERLAREGARRIGVPVTTLQYLVPTLSSGRVAWAAYFTRARYVIGDGAGRFERRYP